MFFDLLSHSDKRSAEDQEQKLLLFVLFVLPFNLPVNVQPFLHRHVVHSFHISTDSLQTC